MKKEFNVSGMSCAACAGRVERAVSGLSGVESCSVNLILGSMTVESQLSDAEIISAVEAAGYGATSADEKKTNITENDNDGLQKSEKRLY